MSRAMAMGVSEEEESFYGAMDVATASTLPMVLKCAIDLNLLNLIRQSGPGASVSASHLASLLPVADHHHAATLIDRILRFLAASSLLNCQLKPLPDANLQRLYSLTPLSYYLTSSSPSPSAQDGDGNYGNEVSLASVSLMIQDKVLMDTWHHLKDAALEGGIPFNRAHGMSAFEYPATDPRFNRIFNQAMHDSSSIILHKILQIYTGFEPLKTLVDVGGGTGASLNIILSKYPNINAINFDLPHVIQHAPPHPGVEHVSGDMFVSVPKGADAIFMKWILHDWSDAHCEKLLRNCYEALPENGKVIIAECILARDPKSSDEMKAFQRAARSDVMMLAYNPGGKERSEEEFQALANGAGFKQFHKVCYTCNTWIMEFLK